MKLKWCCLALALLFLLPACSRQNQPESYHWIPPEKQIAESYDTNDIPPYDPASGMTYEEYLATIDAPIVVSMERIIGTSPTLDLTDSTLISYIKYIRNSPYVKDISFPTLLHWLDNFCGEQIMQFPEELIERNGIHRKDVQYAPMEKATLMIGQYQSALREEQIGEGRKWEDMRECCINRALYEKLLAYEEAEFTGLGDTITVTETLYHRGIMPETQEEGLSITPSDRTIHEYSVVGIVEEEGEYANTDAYGLFHIYAPLDMVKNLIAKHEFNRPNYIDEAMYLIGHIIEKQKSQGEMYLGIFCRSSKEDPAKKELRLSGNRMILEEEWKAQFEDIPVNAGYLMEITLDSGMHYAEFVKYMQTPSSASFTARHEYDSVYLVYEKSLARDEDNAQLNMPPLLQELADADELDDWYLYTPVPRVIRPLRVAGD